MPDAGTITVTSGASVVTLEPAADGSYAPQAGSGDFWIPGQPVQITATGGAMPAATMTLTGPAIFTLTEPAVTSPMSVSRSQPLVVRWTGGTGATGATVVAAFSGRPVGGAVDDNIQVKCSFDAAAGEGTVPVSALAELDPSTPGSFLTLIEDYRTVMIEGWHVRFAARRDSTGVQVTFL